MGFLLFLLIYFMGIGIGYYILVEQLEMETDFASGFMFLWFAVIPGYIGYMTTKFFFELIGGKKWNLRQRIAGWLNRKT